MLVEIIWTIKIDVIVLPLSNGGDRSSMIFGLSVSYFNGSIYNSSLNIVL